MHHLEQQILLRTTEGKVLMATFDREVLEAAKVSLLCCLFLPEALGGVKKLQVTDPTTSSLKVRWDPAEGNVRQYRIFYVPAAGGAEDMVRILPVHLQFALTGSRSVCVCVCVCLQEQVSGGTTSTSLRNLLSDTAYTVTVVPVYPEGEGLPQSDGGKTRESDRCQKEEDSSLHQT